MPDLGDRHHVATLGESRLVDSPHSGAKFEPSIPDSEKHQNNNSSMEKLAESEIPSRRIEIAKNQNQNQSRRIESFQESFQGSEFAPSQTETPIRLQLCDAIADGTGFSTATDDTQSNTFTGSLRDPVTDSLRDPVTDSVAHHRIPPNSNTNANLNPATTSQLLHQDNSSRLPHQGNNSRLLRQGDILQKKKLELTEQELTYKNALFEEKCEENSNLRNHMDVVFPEHLKNASANLERGVERYTITFARCVG
jgi:hypothetical protein